MAKNLKELLLVPHTPMWEKVFLKEKQNLESVLKNNSIEIQHVGSTAIPAVTARPIMDILCVVHTLDGIEMFLREFTKRGYTWNGDGGIPNCINFIRYAKDGETELTNVRVFENGNPLIFDYLDFRDYLIAEEEVAREFDSVKNELKKKYIENPGIYTAAKSQFIQIVLKNLR